MKIIFFGASVTQQGRSKDGVTTGYVHKLKEKFKDSHPDVDVIQKGFGSTSFDSVGFLYLDNIINLKPDIVVLEWHTTWLGKFDEVKYATVIDSLLERGIKVVNLVLPRKGMISPERDCVKQSRGAIKKGAFFLNLIDYLEGGELEEYLRDYVHTTEFGATKYSDYIYNFLVEKVLADGSAPEDSLGESIEVLESYERPAVSSVHHVGTLRYGQKMVLKFESVSHQESDVQVFADMKVGPYSPKIQLIELDRKIQSIWDEWCGFERECVKALTPKFSSSVNSLSIVLADELPSYEKSKYDFSDRSVSSLKCVFTGKIYCVGAALRDVELIE